MILDKAGVPIKSSFEVCPTSATKCLPSLHCDALEKLTSSAYASLLSCLLLCSLLLPRHTQIWCHHLYIWQMTWSETLTLR